MHLSATSIVYMLSYFSVTSSLCLILSLYLSLLPYSCYLLSTSIMISFLLRNNITKTQTSNFLNKCLGAGGASSREVRIKKKKWFRQASRRGKARWQGIWERTWNNYSLVKMVWEAQVPGDQEVPGLRSWLCQVDAECLRKALYMHFLTLLMCKTSTR